MNRKTVSADEYKEVTKVAAKYVEALRIGSIDMLADIFHKDAVTYGTANGRLIGAVPVIPLLILLRQMASPLTLILILMCLT